MEILLEKEINGKTLSIQTGKVARQASGSVVVQYGDTIVLVTAVSDTKEKASSFLPLSVEYQEKIYAAGRIPGNYFRREIGRPSEKETLTARLIDRPIRPLFPQKYRFETQVIATVLSMDQENDPDTLAMLGASAALTISDIPFAGPIASVRVGRIDGQLQANPPISLWEKSDINIIVAGTKTGVVMVEGWRASSSRDALEVAEELKASGVSLVIYTDIKRDGMASGPNLEAARELSALGLSFILSGGIASLEDLERVKGLPGLVGVIVGRALYEGLIDLREAIRRF